MWHILQSHVYPGVVTFPKLCHTRRPGLFLSVLWHLCHVMWSALGTVHLSHDTKMDHLRPPPPPTCIMWRSVNDPKMGHLRPPPSPIKHHMINEQSLIVPCWCWGCDISKLVSHKGSRIVFSGLWHVWCDMWCDTPTIPVTHNTPDTLKMSAKSVSNWLSNFCLKSYVKLVMYAGAGQGGIFAF